MLFVPQHGRAWLSPWPNAWNASSVPPDRITGPLFHWRRTYEMDRENAVY